MPDDLELLRRFAATADEAAFAALVERHVALVHSVALRVARNPDAAQEITSAVFIVLARKARTLDAKTVLPGWLYHTARLTAANYVRGEIRRARRESEALMELSPQETETGAWEHIAPLLETAMARLNPADRDVVVLRYFQNKTMEELAAILHLPETTARKRVTRAVEKLRRFFVRRGVTLSATLLAGVLTAHSVSAAPAGLALAVTTATAQGVTSGSTAWGLAKGTLKFMAWTKTKTVAVAGAAMLLAAGGTVGWWLHWRNTPPPQRGRMHLPTGNITPMVSYSYSRAAIFLASNGSLWSWGEERLGWPVLGLRNQGIQNTTSLRQIGHDTDWVDIAAGDSDCLAVKSDGTLWAWGANIYYQLGDGTRTQRLTPYPSVPGHDWKQVAAGDSHSLALKRDGTLWAWGNNWAGQLGTGTGSATKGPQIHQVGSSTNWVKVWAGGIQSVGLQADGSLWFWGSLNGGDDKKNIMTPTRVPADTNWVDVCFGYFTVFAIKADGTLWCWGRETSFYASHPDPEVALIPQQVGIEADWQSCSSGAGGFYQLLRKKDGSLWALDASEHRIVQAAAKYQPVKFQRINWSKDVAAYTAGGDNIGVVMTADGEVWTWGRVIGELSPKDYYDKKGPIYPESRVIKKPWQLSNFATGE
ncbi:MAG TPA: sigma-70 family RNA polymerase sigma factor [Dongiaceae bacterium]|jgi:RNA polymerase sigma factor (sigma-70 family)|nr:sigma-70 family RNA polymerase sigma factor [Dongiaceae bacterium]